MHHLIRNRHGHVLPDDKSGRAHLWELVSILSIAMGARDEKIRNAIDLWAPWMQPPEAAEMVDHVMRLTIYDRFPPSRVVGERLRLSNGERLYLKLWPIKPFDATDEELEAQRRARQNERRRQKRGRTQAEYLASCLSATKPWEAEGMCRRTWERRRVATRGANNTVYGSTMTCDSLKRGESAKEAAMKEWWLRVLPQK